VFGIGERCLTLLAYGDFVVVAVVLLKRGFYSS